MDHNSSHPEAFLAAYFLEVVVDHTTTAMPHCHKTVVGVMKVMLCIIPSP